MIKVVNFIYNIIHQTNYSFGKFPKTSVPVISVGNINVGGSGKTPFTIYLAKTLIKMGYQPAILSRGYKAKLSYTLVDNLKHTPLEVGDEPYMMARVCPVVIGKNRFTTAQIAIKKSKANILILDDGMQTSSVYKDLSFCVIGQNGLKGFMRESLNQANKKNDAFILINNINQKGLKKETFNFEITTDFKPNKNYKYLAFAGLGHPEKFFKTLKETKAKIVKTISFPDHHSYTQNDIKKLKDEAKKLGAVLITTQKDWVKIKDNKIEMLVITLQPKNEKSFKEFLLSKLKRI